MQDFSVEGSPPNVKGWSAFSRVEENLTIWHIPKICGNFSKICIKINKLCKLIGKIQEKWKFFGIFFNFLAGTNFLII